jgi:predicted secreted protein
MSVGKGFAGRKVALTISGVGSIPIMSKGLSVNNEMIDVTSDTSDGWATALAEPGQKSMELSFSGVVENLDLMYSVVSNVSQIYACTLTYPDGSVVSGDFSFGSFSDTGEYNEKYTFEASLASSGEVTFTPGV